MVKNLIKALIIIFLLFVFYGVFKAINTSIGGDLEKVSSLDFDFSYPMPYSISPACGCFNYSEYIRGVGAYSRKLNININSHDTVYTFLSSNPEVISHNYIPDKYFSVKIYIVSKDKVRGGINTSGFMWQERLKDISDEYYMLDSLNTFKIQGNNLNVIQRGPFPYFAWHPISQKGVKISFDDVKDEVYFVESADEASPKIKPRLGQLDGFINPSVDFIGVPLLVQPLKVTGFQVDYDDFITVSDDSVMIAEINAPFSVRLFMHSSSEMIGDKNKQLLAKLIQKNWLVGFQEKINNEKYLNLDYLRYIRKAARYIVSFDQSGGLVKEYDKIKSNSGRKVIKNYKSSQGYETSMEVRYPELKLDKLGIQIWGKLSSIIFNDAQGNVILNSKNINISAPSKIKIENAKSKKVEYSVIAITTDGIIRFSNLLGELYINNEPKYRFIDKFTYLDILLALIASIAAVLAIAPNYKLRCKKDIKG